MNQRSSSHHQDRHVKRSIEGGCCDPQGPWRDWGEFRKKTRLNVSLPNMIGGKIPSMSTGWCRFTSVVMVMRTVSRSYSEQDEVQDGYPRGCRDLRQWREGWQGYLPRAVLPEAQDSPWIQWVELAFNTARATVLNECPRETWVLLRQQTPRIPSESPEQIQDYLWSGGRAYLFYMHAVSVEVLQVRSCVYCPRRKHARIGNLFRTWWKGDWGFLLYASVWCSDDVVFFFFFFHP